eukprot:CAMPEP_0119038926 /NCGR_PEP_ID=MMETSP1177-20130426/8130_1 /TAXON_ID=2985 /ORGANISM="Ochromonas sp, Strain CCMP1899" /LENGTH=238 /DNA_ID=CAMNT_0007002135 /DNA_START=510 /DNA_END=1223 /DNA_ORIENTATION=+
MKQLGPLYLLANIPDPFNENKHQEEEETSGEYAEALFVDDSSPAAMKEFQQIVNTQAFEISLQRNSRAIRASVFKPATREDKKYTWALLNDEVEAYMSGGNVLVKGLSPVEQFESIDKLRQFFFDYGATVNFCVAQWSPVVLVLYAPATDSVGMNSSGKTPSNGSGNGTSANGSSTNGNSANGSSTKSSYSTNGGFSSPKMSKGAKKAKDMTGYRCVKEGRMYILEIPYKFKAAPLLE